MLLNRTSLLLSYCAAAALGVAGYNSPLAFTSASQGQQVPLGAPTAYDAGLFTPLEDLSSLSHTEFTALSHPAFPNYGVRMKKTQFCDDTVQGYTGYIDIAARHLFFYFFESRNDPANDDVIYWATGGPGCSSSIGLFFELGPCQIRDSDGPTFNPYSWNSNASIFFVDQPIGVGFSYADFGETVSTTEEAAADIAAFVAIFFENFSKFKGNKFHMAGESYGGRYIPVFASAVYDQNTYLAAMDIEPINLASALIGNGITDFVEAVLSYYDMVCTPASVAPFVPISTCVRMKQAYPRCAGALQKQCVDIYDEMNCRAASTFCFSELAAPFIATGLNPYDVSEMCKGGPEDLCYPEMAPIREYLQKNSTRSMLGVDPSASNFTACSSTVNYDFSMQLDSMRPTQDYVAGLLERGVRVLIYVGTLDWICNWVGNLAFTQKMEWSGQAEYVGKELEDWSIDGEVVGKTKSAGNLTFATVYGAGHMVPYNKPSEALYLLNHWLADESLA